MKRIVLLLSVMVLLMLAACTGSSAPNADSDTVMFLDGYVIIKPRVVELETRFTQIFTESTITI